MKKSEFIYKTIQLVLFILLALACLAILFLKPGMYHLVATDSCFRLLCGLLWLTLGLSFLFIYRDFSFFSSYKKDYGELDYAVRSDPLSGLANRFSCDSEIEKYLDKPVPKHLACIMFELDVSEINTRYGHAQGNRTIRQFGELLRTASDGFCFVGRNGGNKFLALFEDATPEKLEQFLFLFDRKVASFNASPDNFAISYRYGAATQEKDGVNTVNDLIALSNKRIADNPPA